MKPLLAIALVRTLLVQATPPQLLLAVPPIPPLNTPFGGVVVLNVAMDSAGTVRNISTVAGASPFLKPSVDSVRRWKFTSAVDSSKKFVVSAVFLYRARQIFSSGPGIYLPQAPPASNQPPLPEFISDAPYPVNSVAEGVVILELKIGANGQIEQIRTVHDVPALTDAARQAVAGWKFSSARTGGKAVEGISIAVISFLRPVIH
jgi:Gram-negative bacterial TonB protein C-terminal